MKTGLVFTVVFAAAVIAVSAGTEQQSVRFAKAGSIISYAPAPKSTSILAIDSRYNRRVSLRTAEASSLFFTPEKTLVISDFPVGIQDYGTVQLRRTNQITDGGTIWFFNDLLRPAPAAVMYSGFIQHETGSKVRLCMVNDRIFGLITRESGESIAITPDEEYLAGTGNHIMASDNDPRFSEIGTNFRCLADEVASRTPDIENKPFAMPTATNLLEVEVGIEVDVPLFMKFLKNNDYDKAFADVQAYVYSLFAFSSTVYEEEINVVLTVPFVKVWSDISETGYPKYNTFGSDIGEMLRRASSVWGSVSNKTGQYKRDLLHVCTAGITGTGNFAGGIAFSGGNNYSGTICDQGSGYAVSGLKVDETFPVYNFQWDLVCVTHEMGHNFRSPHTHSCESNVWPQNKPLDTCVIKSTQITDPCFSAPVKPVLPPDRGTIMSYCHINFTKGVLFEFRPIVAAVIRDGAERGISRGCVSEPANPLIKLQYPLGRNTIAGGTTDTIRWNSSKVNTVRVEYSDNNGQSWTQIGTDVPASVRVMPWLVPVKGSSQYLVRVIDPANTNIGDSSWVGFTVQATSLTLQYPLGGERIGMREKPVISWSSQLVTAVKIEFSSNGGADWQTLIASTSGNNFNWDVPDIETNQGVIRVSAVPGGGVVSQSQPFAIGKEKLQMVNRDNLDTLCRTKVWKVQWVSDFMASVANVHVAYSTDGGKTWTNLTTGLGPRVTAGIFEGWNVPDVESANARLRIYRRGDEAVADTVACIITNCTFTSVAESWGESGTPLLEVLPNPSRNEVLLHLSLGAACESAEFYLTDVRGQKVASLGTFDNLIAGQHSLGFDIAAIAPGAYFLTFQSGARTVSTAMRIVR